MAETGLRKTRVVAELTRSTHGKLEEFMATGVEARDQDPEFYAHLVAWNEVKGQIRDSKVALPVLAIKDSNPIFAENAMAHLAKLDPRNFVRATEFSRVVHGKNLARVRALVSRYLKAREANWSWWERTALQHKQSLKTLYGRYHVKPAAMADLIVMQNKPPVGTVFHGIRNLKDMTDADKASFLLKHKVPFLVVVGALGGKPSSDVVMAMMEAMTPTEIVTNVKMLEKLGVKTIATLRATFEEKLEQAAKSKKSTFKTTRAAEAQTDVKLKEKLHGLQEKQMQAVGKVQGSWIVLADRSGSMATALEVARVIVGALTGMVEGSVYLIPFDTSPRIMDMTGKPYDQVKAETANISAGGGTSIGCGLLAAIDKGLDFTGIVVVSDAAENSTPYFTDVYKKVADANLPVYLYRVGQRAQAWGLDKDLALSMEKAGYDLQEFDLTGIKVDYNSLPNLVQTMRANRYSLIDEIMETPLLTLDKVFNGRADA